ncbi:MAG: Gfo/Idh/MocA family oxidoreductase [Chloroflexi bacterium]|nr:Gfo/Idh/MocA family oxidoreductase [Chloroflexota bacterium]
MAKDSVGVGVIGTGFGVRVQIPVWSQTPGARVVAVCSHDQARATAVADRFDIPHAVTDDRELAELPDVDLVSIVTPPYLHHPGVMAAIEAGKHVLCEKPFALDQAQALEMLEAARAKGVIHLVNFEFRTTPARIEMRRRFREGSIGELLHVHVTAFGDFVRMTEGRTARWWYQAKKGGGWLGASGSHTIDTLRFVFGEIVGVGAQIETVIKEHRPLREETSMTIDADDTFFLLFRMAGGALGAFLSGAAIAAGGGTQRIEAYGSEGTLVLDGDTLLVGKKGDRSLEEVRLPAPEAATEAVDPHYIPMGVWTSQIVEAVKAGKQIAPSFEDGWRSQQVIDAARQSAAEGRWVDIDV